MAKTTSFHAYLNRIILLLCLAMLSYLPLTAQAPQNWDAGKIRLELEKLRVLGGALYIAAHPDDENTGVLAYLANGKRVRTAYLSLTRGDGGQNLIGPEKGDLLGVIRTQELLAARRIDGAGQFFSRAIDFGYTTSRDEALEVWGHREMLSDVVWVIRKFRPDILLTRFTPELGGHGQHLASALLAQEAFDAAGDRSQFPEQLAFVQPWQPRRLLWDVWRQEIDTTGLPRADVGTYNTLLGNSYTEIAALSRSQHRCQGFGMSAYRGSYVEHFQVSAGETAGSDLFEGVPLGWERVPGGDVVDKLLAKAVAAFLPQDPTTIIPLLLKARQAMTALQGNYYADIKREALDALIRQVCGMWTAALVDDPIITPGEAVQLQITLVNRGGYPMRVTGLAHPFAMDEKSVDTVLPANTPVSIAASVTMPADAPLSQPYWLRQAHTGGRFQIADQQNIGLTERSTLPPLRLTMEINGQSLTYPVPVQHRWTDPVRGERYRELEVLPSVTVNFSHPLLIFENASSKIVRVDLKSARQAVNGTIVLQISPGWRIDPEQIQFDFAEKGQEKSFPVHIFPPASHGEARLSALLNSAGRTDTARALTRIEYDHIPIQTLTPAADIRMVRLKLERGGREIGYIVGAGDDIPRMLEQIGYRVTLLSDDDLDATELSRFDAIISGVRAYNTRPRLKHAQARLMDYVFNGGTLVIQFNTAHRLVTDELGPYPVTLSRDRITREDAALTLLAPTHRVFQYPNRITAADFEGWVQERGLYFPGDWDARYVPLLTGSDPQVAPTQGSLLYAEFGKGRYVYTGLAFFRQLPAGVPGAFRLFVNLIAGGK